MFAKGALLVTAFLGVAAAKSGCGAEPPLAPGTSRTHHIKSSGGEREYIVFLPKNYQKSKPTPLIFSYPGHSDSDSYQRNLTQLDNPFFNQDHIVIYPQGLDGTDHKASWSGAPYSDTKVNDLKFTEDLLDHIEEKLCIDTRRVFATGKSNGGGFVNYLACHPLSSRFTAFAPVAGAYYLGYGADGAACRPARRPQPFLEIHGYNDSVIPYPGDANHNGGALPPVLDFVEAWAARNGCADRSKWHKSSEEKGQVDHYDFGCHTYHYAVRRADHVWESTVGNADTERYDFGPSAINASSVVMNFFRSVQPLKSGY